MSDQVLSNFSRQVVTLRNELFVSNSNLGRDTQRISQELGRLMQEFHKRQMLIELKLQELNRTLSRFS